MLSDDEGVPECRVCRGEETPDNPLFSPCNCNGSIKFVHQACLEQWLEQSGKVSCELCEYKFHFSRRFATDAPARLPTLEVLECWSTKVVTRMLPLALRVCLAVLVWLGLVPWSTCLLYRVWMMRSAVSAELNVSRRLTFAFMWADIKTGIVLVLAILLVFLALMSFADFLRFNWDENPHLRGVEGDADADVNEGEGVGERGEGHAGADAAAVAAARVQVAGAADADADAGGAAIGDGAGAEAGPGQRHAAAERAAAARAPVRMTAAVAGRAAPHGPADVGAGAGAGAGAEAEAAEVEAAAEAAEAAEAEAEAEAEAAEAEAAGAEADAEVEADLDLDDLELDDEQQIELNIALDELLGIGGPPHLLLRNAFWFLVFNAAFLGFFVFVPFTVGSACVAVAHKHFPGLSRDVFAAVGGWHDAAAVAPYAAVVRAAVAESVALGMAVHPQDVLIVCLGVAVISATLLTWQLLLWWQMVYLDCLGSVGTHVLWILEGTAAIMKVSVLLCLKMLVLPVVLGCCIDYATLDLFGTNCLQRVQFGADHVLGWVLLHWVVGISFMLIITVTVLQLREVLHPDLLARIIRPQEAHPDLLMTLLEEPWSKHARRMFMSMLIYTALLLVFVRVPVHFAVRSRLLPDPIVRVQLFYFFPDLQVPFELLVFHTAILSMLERSKNSIGRCLHVWLVKACRVLRLTRYLLPLARSTPAARVSDHAGSGGGGADGDLTPLQPPPLGMLQDDWRDARRQEREREQRQRAAGGAPVRRRPWPEDGSPGISLAPRVAPDWCWLRMLCLLLAAWISTLACMLVYVCLPLLIGRGAFSALHVPASFAHDPFAMVLGALAVWVAAQAVRFAMSVRLPSADFLRRARFVGLALRWAPAAALWGGIVPSALGVFFQLAVVLPLPLERAGGEAADGEGVGGAWGGDVRALLSAAGWAAGTLFLNLFAAGAVYGFWDVVDAQQYWKRAVRGVCASVARSLRSGDWEQFDAAAFLHRYARRLFVVVPLFCCFLAPGCRVHGVCRC
eukprot:g2332.t1